MATHQKVNAITNCSEFDDDYSELWENFQEIESISQNIKKMKKSVGLLVQLKKQLKKIVGY